MINESRLLMTIKEETMGRGVPSMGCYDQRIYLRFSAVLPLDLLELTQQMDFKNLISDYCYTICDRKVVGLRFWITSGVG